MTTTTPGAWPETILSEKATASITSTPIRTQKFSWEEGPMALIPTPAFKTSAKDQYVRPTLLSIPPPSTTPNPSSLFPPHLLHNTNHPARHMPPQKWPLSTIASSAPSTPSTSKHPTSPRLNYPPSSLTASPPTTASQRTTMAKKKCSSPSSSAAPAKQDSWKPTSKATATSTRSSTHGVSGSGHVPPALQMQRTDLARRLASPRKSVAT